MASHHQAPIDKDQRYDFSAKAQSRLILCLVAGLVLTLVGCFVSASGMFEGHHEASEFSSFTSSPVKAGGGHSAHHNGTDLGATHEGGGMASAGHEGEGHVGSDPVHAKAEPAQHGAEHNGKSGGQYEEGHHGDQSSEHGQGHHEYHWYQRLFSNLWLDGVFFTGLAVIGLFFVAIQYVSQAGWSAAIVRVPMSFASFLPITLGVLVVTFLVGGHDIFHWTHSELYDKSSPEFDPILNGKHGYLNTPFFLVRMVLFVGLWWWFNSLIRKNSLQEDLAGKTNSIWRKNHQLSAIFLVIFAVSSSMVAWDWLMSVEPHWYSTLFGWYTFASWHVSGWALIALVLVLLKERGYLPFVNENHLHDVGKFMFALSIFWTYLWIAQYLLIWYANIPEEGIYFIERVRGFDGHYSALFFVNLFLNFVFPFLFFMTRDAKRTMIFLKVGACAILMGHWMDFYLMIMPGTVGGHSGFGFIEFGLLLMFVSGFILVISKSLASAPLLAKNHPMLEESLHHDI